MRSSRRHEEKGASAVELVLYMPLLIIAILLTVQFALIYLGNQVVSAAAREASRTARVTGDTGKATDKAREYTREIGGGALENVKIDVQQIGDTEMRATVTGSALAVLPFFPPPTVREEVQGPIERFAQDPG